MKPLLGVRLSGPELTADTSVDWVARHSDGRLDHSRDALMVLGERWAGVEGLELTVVAPAETISLTEVSIPSRQLRQVKQALPYMVEELVAEPIEQVHLGLPPELPPPEQPVPVAVLAHQHLIRWLDCLTDVGLHPAAVVTEVQALPWQPRSWTLWLQGERLLFRHGPWQGFALARDQFPQLLEWLRQAPREGPAPLLQVHVDAGAPAADELVATLRRQLDLEVRHQVHDVRHWTEWLLPLATGQRPAINMLQGGYQVRRPGVAGFRLWRPLSLVAGLLLGVHLALLAGSGLWFDARARQLETEMVELYRQQFPEARRVLSPRRQWAARMSGQRDALLPMLAELARLDLPLELQQVQYRRRDPQMMIEVEVPSAEQLDRLRQLLVGRGLVVESGRSRAGPGGLHSQLLIAEEPP